MKEAPVSIRRPALCLEVEIPFGIVVRYVTDHLMDEFHLAYRQLSVLQVFSNEVAEDPAEIFVASVGKEAA